MQVLADLHIHSKYSRAVSQEMAVPKIWEWAKRKGIDLVATGDWTHPLWMREIKANLQETGNGLLKLKIEDEELKMDEEGPYFLLTTEVSSIYSQGGKTRRIHNLIWSSSIATCEKINKELTLRGVNLISDGRPIFGLTSQQLAEIVFGIDPTCLLVPAHVWTPWFSLYGSKSGFDSIDECFGSFARYIYAVETGLSSDPMMNWRVKELDDRSIVSFSDAHSGPKLGREVTVFELSELSFNAIRGAIVNSPQPTTHNLQPGCIAYTIEFYPEEGKYHYTGHRNCQIKQNPGETKRKGTICPVCGKKLTIGVMHRVEELAERTQEELRIKKQELKGTNIKGIFSAELPKRPPYVKLVPLPEILAETIGNAPTSQNIKNEYNKLVDYFGSEFSVLLKIPISKIPTVSGEKVARAIEKVRTGDIFVDPGYDGVFGRVEIWREEKGQEKEKTKEQMTLF